MIDVSDLMNDPDFAFNYYVLRTMGKWEKGRFILSPTPQRLEFYGPVQPATAKEIVQLDIGDQPGSIMRFSCKLPRQLFLTRDLSEVESEEDGAASDLVLFRNCTYSIIRVMPWDHYGWQRAFAVEKGGVLWRPST